MQYEGTLVKMPTELADPIQYYLVFEDNFIQMNQLIGRNLTIEFIGYQCLGCGKRKKIFSQGFCYDCFNSNPAAGEWIMHPELSKAHLGIEDRDLEYEKKVQLQPHVVYLALNSAVKVGVTRKSQVPTRWIDQGASEAVAIIELPNRYLAGITEVALKNHFADKTNWRKMLQNEVANINLLDVRKTIEPLFPEEVLEYYHPRDEDRTQLHYPVLAYPKKVASLNLEKTSNYTGKLVGIKGQYLIFEDSTVFNVRTFEGYRVKLSV